MKVILKSEYWWFFVILQSTSLHIYSILPLGREYYAHIVDLDNVTEQRRPPFCSAEEWSAIIFISKPSVDLPPSVERQLEKYLKSPEIKKTRESFDSYEEVTTDEDKYARRIIDH